MARMKAELELAEADGTSPPVERMLEDLDEAFGWLSAAEDVQPHVLVVDDDHRLAEITAKGLRRLGYDAHASASLRKPRAGEVVVVDLGVLSGLADTDLEKVRVVRPIVVTGATDHASRALGARVDASDYLVKPVDLNELRAAIDRRNAER